MQEGDGFSKKNPLKKPISLSKMTGPAGRFWLLESAPLRKECIFFYENLNRRQNCWDTILKQGNYREQKNPPPSPNLSIQSWGICCFLQVARTSAQHCIDRMGEQKLYFLLLKSVKRKKAQFRAKCLNSFCRRLYSLFGVYPHVFTE